MHGCQICVIGGYYCKISFGSQIVLFFPFTGDIGQSQPFALKQYNRYKSYTEIHGNISINPDINMLYELQEIHILKIETVFIILTVVLYEIRIHKERVKALISCNYQWKVEQSFHFKFLLINQQNWITGYAYTNPLQQQDGTIRKQFT